MQEDALSQATNSIMIDNIEEIDHKMFKYGENAVQNLKKDNTSVSLSNAAPAFVELIKLEKFSMTWGSLHKSPHSLDFLVGFLQEIKNIFKPYKSTLFILDKGLQQRTLAYKDKKRNYRKVLVGSTNIYAVYALEEDYCTPCFKTIEEA